MVALSTLCCLFFLLADNILALIEFDISLVPHAHENEYFEIYYLQSSNVPIDLDSSDSSYTVQISGLAVRSSVSEKVVIVEYRPVDLSTCFLPTLSRLTLATDFLWDKRAMIALSRELNVTAWPTSIFLARVNSVVYWQYMLWVNEYTKSHPIFVPQSICMAGSNDDCPYPTQNWDTFIADSFMQLSEYAVSITPFAPLLRTEWIIHTLTSPQELVYEVGLEKYYKSLAACVRSSVGVEFMVALGTCLASDPSSRDVNTTAPTTVDEDADNTVVVFLHYSQNVYLKLTATVDVMVTTTSSIPTVATPSRLDIPLPPPHDQQIEKRATSDFIIMALIVALMGFGFLIGLLKTGFLQRCFSFSCSCCFQWCCCCCGDWTASADSRASRAATQGLELLHRRIRGGGRGCKAGGSVNDHDDYCDGFVDESTLQIHTADMDSASHGFQNDGRDIHRSSSPNETMNIEVTSDSSSSSNGGGGINGRKSKSQLVHEAIMNAATGGRGYGYSQDGPPYSQLRIDDDDDDDMI